MTSHFGYQLLSKLDESPAGTAWRARARESGAQALVRVFHGTRWGSEDARGAFQARADILDGLEHPHLARQIQAGCLPDGRPFVVSEYLDGEDLATHVRRDGELNADELALLVLPLCSVLTELRSRGVVVGTLPPEQVFLVGGLSSFSPKLIGPGLADGTGAPEARADVRALGHLMDEVGLSVPGWMTPVVQGCLLPEDAGGFPTPEAVARAVLDAQPRTELLPTKDGDRPPLLLVDESEREKVGDVLGQYRLERLLGEGAMGRVFQARHVSLGRPAAIKVLRVEHARNSHLIQRFFYEARAVNRINHAHIVEILDFVEETSVGGLARVYCVMEMLEGRSLTELLARDRPSVARSVGIVRQVCSALQAAHHVGVIHRDVKPDNLFVLERDGRDFVKVLDFGVAKLATPLGGDLPLTTTVEGTIVGTPAYMAPEQATGGSAEPRTDLYAVGVVLYELLAGHPPFQAPAFGQLVAQVLTAPPPQLPTHTLAGDRIPSAVGAVVRRALAKDPADRFDTLDALSTALEAAERKVDPPVRGRWAVAAAALVALVALSAFVFRSGRGKPVAAVVRPPVAAAARMPSGGPLIAELPADTVPLTVASTPPGARVVEAKTGRVLGTTPFVTRLDRSGTPWRLRLEQPGHDSAELDVVPDAERSVRIALDRARRRQAPAPSTTAAAIPQKPRRTSKLPDPFKL
jgi:eukaryotic-like serine/threonine-protein kinase